jgi:H/ACA ribonucleoprotein complex non-core subunit NAF1
LKRLFTTMAATTVGQDMAMEDDIEDIYGDLPAKESFGPKALAENRHDNVATTGTASITDKLAIVQLPGIGGNGSLQPDEKSSYGMIKEEHSAPFPKNDMERGVTATTTEHSPANGSFEPSNVVKADSIPPQDSIIKNGSQDVEHSEAFKNQSTLSKQMLQASNVLNAGIPEQGEATHIQEHGATNPGEWEPDSSPYESSSDDSSDTTSSGSDEDYELLDPAEQARRLMEDEGNSDDDGHSKGPKGGRIKSHNEAADEPVEMPDITVSPEMTIEELGAVATVVDNIALIKAKTSGEFQVLEARSLLCLKDRTVIGVVSETLGRVHEPLYCARFRSAAAMEEAGIHKGVVVFYVPQHSTFVFTNALRNIKGSDASNIYDEEAADDEVEFSDDEAEAEHKRNRKAQKQARRQGRSEYSTNGQRARDGQVDQSASINYDDEPQEEHYTPLSRPANLHEMMNQSGGALEAPSRGHRGNRNHRGDRGRSRGRGRQNNARAPPHFSHGQASHPDVPPNRGGFNYNPPSNNTPSNHNLTGYESTSTTGPQAFAYQQPPYSQPSSTYPTYPMQPAYQNAQNPPPFPWGGAPHGGAPPGGRQHQHAQHFPPPPQYPAGVAINPWFFQGQHPPNSGNR